MSDSKTMIRYLGYRSQPDGGRRFDFSVAQGTEFPMEITIQALPVFFSGPDRIAIQEATSICYETLKVRIHSSVDRPPRQFDLTSVDVAQHRKLGKSREIRH